MTRASRAAVRRLAASALPRSSAEHRTHSRSLLVGRTEGHALAGSQQISWGAASGLSAEQLVLLQLRVGANSTNRGFPGGTSERLLGCS